MLDHDRANSRMVKSNADVTLYHSDTHPTIVVVCHSLATPDVHNVFFRSVSAHNHDSMRVAIGMYPSRLRRVFCKGGGDFARGCVIATSGGSIRSGSISAGSKLSARFTNVFDVNWRHMRGTAVDARLVQYHI